MDFYSAVQWGDEMDFRSVDWKVVWKVDLMAEMMVAEMVVSSEYGRVGSKVG